MKKRLLIIPIVMLAMLVAFSAPAAADYNFDGYELRNMINGTVQGDVYVGGGHGAPTLIYPGGINPENPYNQTFEVPDKVGSNGENVTWARLYVGVWAGNAVSSGWVNVTFTNNTGNPTTLGNVMCDGEDDDQETYDTTVPSVYGTGCGCWMVAFNCTSNVTSGTNTANVTTGSGFYDGRVYGIVLVVVYENSSSATVQYWVNEGNVNLHYNMSATYPALNNNVTWFNGTAYNCTEGNLTVLYYAGDSNQNDYLFLNVENVSNSPGNVSNDNIGWNNGSSYWKYQLDNNNVANESSDNCSVNYSECCCCSDCNCCCDCSESVAGETYDTNAFDFNCFSETNDSTPLCDIINHTANNYAIFWRGHDDNGNGTIDGGWNATNAEGEIYLHPILAVLRLKNVTHVYDFSDNFTGTPGTDAWAFEGEVSNRPPCTANDPNGAIDSYTNIEADDGIYETYVTTTDGKYAAHRFNFSIDETAPDEINVTWNGKGWHDKGGTDNGAYLYIYNFSATSNRCEELDNTTLGTEVTLTGVNKSVATNYISPSGNVTILVVQKSAQTTVQEGEDEVTKYSRIETDYVKLVVTPDP